MLKMTGPAPLTESGYPVCAVAVVETAHVGMPMIDTKLFRCGALMSTLTSAPLVVVIVTLTVTPLVPWV